MEVLIIFWAICAALGYVVAKDGSKPLGAVMGLLLGPIGVVVAAVMK